MEELYMRKQPLVLLQYSIYDMANRAFNKLKMINDDDNMLMIETHVLSFEERDFYMDMHVKAESYRMLIVNYLLALLGNKKNDKLSIPNNARENEKEMVENFCNEYKTELNQLYKVRDKFYTYYECSTENKILFEIFIEACLSFLKCYFDNSEDLKPANIINQLMECESGVNN